MNQEICAGNLGMANAKVKVKVTAAAASPATAASPAAPSPAAPLVTAAAPRTSLGTLFSDAEVAALRVWMSTCRGPALATAVSGSGLSTLVRLLAKEAGMDVVLVGCGTTRLKAVLAEAGASPYTVTLRRKVIVIEEIEAMAAGGETAQLVEAVSFAKTNPPVPVLFVGRSVRSQKPHEFAKAWPRFAFARPSAPRVAAYLEAVARKCGVAVDRARVDELARAAAGDVRSALMALDVHRRKADGGADIAHAKDEAEDGLDVAEAILRGERGGSVAEGVRAFFQEPGMVPMAVYENYLTSMAKDADAAGLAAAAAVAEHYSAADAVDKYIYSHQAWDSLHEAYGAFAVAGPSMVLAARRAARAGARAGTTAPRITKFGTAWSKAHNMSAKVKHVRALRLAFAAAGRVPMGACDLAWVRGCLKTLLGPEGRASRQLCAWWKPLAAPEMLCLARLDVTGSADWYKQSTHARVKKALALA